MKVFVLGSGPAWIWVRAFLDNAAKALIVKPEIIVLGEASPRDFLAELTVEPSDVLVSVQQELLVNEILPPDALRNEAQKAILAIELARQVPRTLLLKVAEAAEWPRLISELLGTGVVDVEPLDVPAETAAENGNVVGSASLLRRYLAPLLAATKQSNLIAVAWPRDCFLYGDAPGEILPATVEVAGRGRILAYGPYMPLPLGRWRAIAFLGFSADIGSMPFILEADSDVGITRGFFEVKQGGIFTIDLEFEVIDSFYPVEFRLISQDSALEGLVSLIEIRLEQLPA